RYPTTIVIHLLPSAIYICSFFFPLTTTTEIYTLSLHDALPILTYVAGLALFYAILGLIAGLSGSIFGTISSNRWSRLVIGSVLLDRKSTRLNSSHVSISYAVFCLKKKKTTSTLVFFSHLEYIA